jgi:hypothetical protein
MVNAVSLTGLEEHIILTITQNKKGGARLGQIQDSVFPAMELTLIKGKACGRGNRPRPQCCCQPAVLPPSSMPGERRYGDLECGGAGGPGGCRTIDVGLPHYRCVFCRFGEDNQLGPCINAIYLLGGLMFNQIEFYFNNKRHYCASSMDCFRSQQFVCHGLNLKGAVFFTFF